ncbi:MAG: TVP38/TMEM64 family protein [Candidatus Omnitrophica bacterium]|nr:TVP38/TMEM64 family protein [Candidatus Omnitrophota bacterium]
MNKISSRVLIAAGIAAALFITVAWWIVHYDWVSLKFLTPSFIREKVLSYGQWSVLAYLAIYLINTLLIFPPNAPISLSAGLIFGHLWGGVIILVSAGISTSAAFFIARCVERKYLDRLLQGKWRDFSDKLAKKGFLTILLLRLVPIVPFEILNYASGLSRISYKDFLLGTFLGMIPGAFVTAYFGGTLGDLDSFDDLLSPKILITAGLLVLFLSIPAIYLFVRFKRHQYRGLE